MDVFIFQDLTNYKYFSLLKEQLSKQDSSIIIISGMFQLYLNNYLFFDNEEGSDHKSTWHHGVLVPIKKNNTIEIAFKEEIEQLSNNNKIILVYLCSQHNLYVHHFLVCLYYPVLFSCK